MHVLPERNREDQAAADDEEGDTQCPNRSGFTAAGNLTLFVVLEVWLGHALPVGNRRAERSGSLQQTPPQANAQQHPNRERQQ
jgi:hypothetical protein